MFTGIVEEVGLVRAVVGDGDHARLTVEADLVSSDADIGDSIAVDGCCLTVVALSDDGFAADMMAETLRVTSLGDLAAGDRVNLERPMRADRRFGGHLVQGHVDGVGEVVARDEQPGTVMMTIDPPRGLSRYLVPRGSVTLAGISLTLVDVDGHGRFRVGLIPHTLTATNLGGRRPGDRVNLEVDVVAKYVESLLQAGSPSPYRHDAPEEHR